MKTQSRVWTVYFLENYRCIASHWLNVVCRSSGEARVEARNRLGNEIVILSVMLHPCERVA